MDYEQSILLNYELEADKLPKKYLLTAKLFNSIVRPMTRELKKLMQYYWIPYESSLFMMKPIRTFEKSHHSRNVLKMQERRFESLKIQFALLVEKYRVKVDKLHEKRKKQKGNEEDFDIHRELYLASLWHPENKASRDFVKRHDINADKSLRKFLLVANDFYDTKKLTFETFAQYHNCCLKACHNGNFLKQLMHAKKLISIPLLLVPELFENQLL